VFGHFLASKARALDLNPRQVLERALDEAHAAQARALTA
jgi:hypothetical protein